MTDSPAGPPTGERDPENSVGVDEDADEHERWLQENRPPHHG
ncbi:MAG TPA: hypothetical protein VFR17_06805 [Mycobacterium sp.]|nr:hypothetical protein [Mycobacterium sp.]